MVERCENYCGVSCIDGTCPVALRDDYIEYGIPVVWKCQDCHKYNGCNDCMFMDEQFGCLANSEHFPQEMGMIEVKGFVQNAEMSNKEIKSIDLGVC